MTTPDEIKEAIATVNPDALFADGFEQALIGAVCRFDLKTPVALYDLEKCIRILKRRDDMTDEDAREYFNFNVLGSYVGEHTPAFALLGAGAF